jgi:hypothetical protein
MAKSKQTKGKVALRGKIFGLKKAGENIVDNEKQRKINFLIKTDEDNTHFVTVNQWKGGMKKAYLFKNEKDEDGKNVNEKKVVSWNERYNYTEQGFSPIGIRTKASTDDKVISLYEFDFIDFLLENFNDGDSVFMRGDWTFSKGKDGVYKNLEPTDFYPTKEEVDFEAEDFSETAEFSLNFIFESASPIEDKVIVSGFVFDWQENPIKLNFAVHKDIPELQKYLIKEASFGSAFSVEGNIHDRVKYREIESTPDGEGFGKKSSSFSGYTRREIESEFHELEITYSDMPVEGVYTKKEIESMGSNKPVNNKGDKDIKPDKSAKLPWE